MTGKTFTLVAVLLSISASLIFAGCQSQGSPNEKQARLLATENADLRQQLAARQTEIQAIRQQHAEELRQQEKELTTCRTRIEILQKDIAKGIDERVSGVTTALVDENAALRKEVEQLKAQIEELKKQAEP